jgi:polar amino acid transport system substrate-binding protein
MVRPMLLCYLNPEFGVDAIEENGNMIERRRKISCLAFATMLLPVILALPIASAQETPAPSVVPETGEGGDYPIPLFRHIDPGRPLPDLKAVESLRIAVDEDFPPFSYKERTGALNGFNVAMASAICEDLRLTCEFSARSWDDLMPALERGEVDAVIAGVNVTQEAVDTADFTGAYYRSLGRFAVRKQNPIVKADMRTLAGKRVGVVRGTAHEAWINRYFPRSNIRPLATAEEALEALRSGVVDAYFGDALQIMFWLTGNASQDCCRFVAGGYNDPDYFSHGMAIAVKRGNTELRDVLDYGLDRLQSSGNFAEIFRRYFPMSPY